MGEAYASRPIDIDIIFYGEETFSDERLTIPYHFLDEREYALRPVAEIAPERRHPALEHTPREMLDALTKLY
jgi:2-amino-4-hydroxy-6-hydroxymethyldihydropteridine diphosphokinase